MAKSYLYIVMVRKNIGEMAVAKPKAKVVGIAHTKREAEEKANNQKAILNGYWGSVNQESPFDIKTGKLFQLQEMGYAVTMPLTIEDLFSSGEWEY